MKILNWYYVPQEMNFQSLLPKIFFLFDDLKIFKDIVADMAYVSFQQKSVVFHCIHWISLEGTFSKNLYDHIPYYYYYYGMKCEL